MSDSPIRLNLGAGTVEIPGYIPIDHKTGGEVFPVMLGTEERAKYPDSDGIVKDGVVDEVRASHVLEHFPMRKIRDVLAEWTRVLKIGGTLKVAVPNYDFIHEQYSRYLRGESGYDEMMFGYLFGGQHDADDFHKCAFNADTLKNIMTEVGIEDIKPWTSEAVDCAALPVSLNLMGIKSKTPPRRRIPKPGELPKIAGIMSMPRLAFSQNMFCALQELAPMGIEFTKMEGAFWGQCIERGIEAALAIPEPPEFILTIDYDTVFHREAFLDLLELIRSNPHVDAVAPLQVKRDEAAPLLGLLDPATGEQYTPGTQITTQHFAPSLVPASWAHFGLTIFRASAFANLPKPWFHSKPNAEGNWGEGRLDDDIYFWRNFTAAGRKLFIAPRVGVGHLQLMCSWLGHDFKPVHQYAADFPKLGKPEGTR